MCDGKTTVALLGAENGIRTRDLNLGKVALYQLSYFRIRDCKYTPKICNPKFFYTSIAVSNSWRKRISFSK